MFFNDRRTPPGVMTNLSAAASDKRMQPMPLPEWSRQHNDAIFGPGAKRADAPALKPSTLGALGLVGGVRGPSKPDKRFGEY